MALGTIGLRTKLLYGFGTVAYGIKDNGFNFLLLIFYNQLLGLPAQLVGLAIMIALIIDGFSDPLIGHISDRFHSRFGRRHFFMYLAALPCAVVYYLLWNPPLGLGTGALFWYLLTTAIIVRILIALYEVPSAALLAELTEDYDLRTSLNRACNLSRDSREIRDALANRPFLSMIACGFFSAMALGLVVTLSIYFYTYYWELSADQVSQLLLSALISAAGALALAPIITRRLDKKRGAIAASRHFTGAGVRPDHPAGVRFIRG